MARVLFLHGHHRHAVGAAFRGQVEIHDFRELLFQDRHEDFVHGHAQHRRLIRWTPGVGAVIDRIAAVGDALHGEYRETFHLVVITGVVAERAFLCQLVRVDMAFQNELGAGRYLQVIADAFHQLGFRAAQQPGKGVFAEGIRHRGDRAEDGGRVSAERHSHREGFPRVGLLPLLEIQGAAAVAEPAHDQLVAANQLLAVDAQVLTFLVGSPGDYQWPGDQRAGVAGPAGLDGELVEIHRVAFQYLFLAGARAAQFGAHAQYLAEHR